MPIRHWVFTFWSLEKLWKSLLKIVGSVILHSADCGFGVQYAAQWRCDCAKTVNGFKSKLERERAKKMGLSFDWRLLDLKAVTGLILDSGATTSTYSCSFSSPLTLCWTHRPYLADSVDPEVICIIGTRTTQNFFDWSIDLRMSEYRTPEQTGRPSGSTCTTRRRRPKSRLCWSENSDRPKSQTTLPTGDCTSIQ